MHSEALKEMARILRMDAMTAVHAAGSGHIGGCLSCAEIMAVLHFHVLRGGFDQKDRDRFVLSKGHSAPIYYAALARKGAFPTEWLKSLRKLGSPLQGHPDNKKTPGVDMCSGSLGQGLSAANGMALYARHRSLPLRVYCLLGDGELEEGQVWEAAMTAAHYKLDNLCAVVDNNGLQIDGPIEAVMSPMPIAEKFAAFGWNAVSVAGHDVDALLKAFSQAALVKGKPTVLVAKTVKGKGVSFMENAVKWHGAAPDDMQYAQAMRELQSGAKEGYRL